MSRRHPPALTNRTPGGRKGSRGRGGATHSPPATPPAKSDLQTGRTWWPRTLTPSACECGLLGQVDDGGDGPIAPALPHHVLRCHLSRPLARPPLSPSRIARDDDLPSPPLDAPSRNQAPRRTSTATKQQGNERERGGGSGDTREAAGEQARERRRLGERARDRVAARFHLWLYRTGLWRSKGHAREEHQIGRTPVLRP